MKHLLYLIIFLVCAINLNSQPLWEYVDSSMGAYSITVNLDNSFDGNIITIVNSKEERHTKSLIEIHDINTGMVLKQSEYDIDSFTTIDLEWIYPIPETEKYIIVGSADYGYGNTKRGYFLKTIWDKELNLLSDTVIKVPDFEKGYYLWNHRGVITDSGDLYYIGICGILRYYIKETMIIKMDRSGNILNTKYIKSDDGRYPLFASAIEETLNHTGLICTGAGNYTIDYDLNILDTIMSDSKLFTHQKSCIRKFNDKHYLITGKYSGNSDAGILKVDSALNVVEEYSFGLPQGVEVGLIRRNFDWIDSSSIFIGAHEVSYGKYFVLANFNSNIRLNWIKYYGTGSKHGYIPYSILATQDGGCVVAGLRGKPKKYQVPENRKAWMMKFDAEGNTVSTDDFEKSDWSITVYPNPSSGDFKLYVEGSHKSAKLHISDMQGRQIKAITDIKQGDNSFNFSNFPKGMYIWTLEDKGGVIGSGKWVKK